MFQNNFDQGHSLENKGPNLLRLSRVIPTPAEGGEESQAYPKATHETPHGVYPEQGRRARSDISAHFHTWWCRWQPAWGITLKIVLSTVFAKPAECLVFPLH